MADELAAVFQSLGLHSRTHPHLHALYFEYPAIGLVPDSSPMSLRSEPPYGVTHREEPQLDKYELDANSLEFFHRFHVKENPYTISHEHELVNAIQHAATQAGKSTLEVVPVIDEDTADEAYLFRLTTISHNEEIRHVFQYTEDSSTWQDLMHSRDAAPWMIILADLMERASERAYFHVQQRLEAYGYITYEKLEWNTQPVKTFNELLAVNMRRIERVNEYEYLTPLQYLWKQSTKTIPVRLPCEHDTETTLHHIASFTKQQCIDACCVECGERIMSHKDIEHGHHSLERRRRERDRVDQLLWTRVEQEDNYAGFYINITGLSLVKAL